MNSGQTMARTHDNRAISIVSSGISRTNASVLWVRWASASWGSVSAGPISTGALSTGPAGGLVSDLEESAAKAQKRIWAPAGPESRASAFSLPEFPCPLSQLQVRCPNQCQQDRGKQHQGQAEGHPDLDQRGQFRPAQYQQCKIPPSQQARPVTNSGGMMLDATTSCSLAAREGLCICLLAISFVDLTSSTFFFCTFLPLLLFGCPLFARFLFPGQVKPVVVK